MTKRVRTEFQGEVFNHRLLWKCAKLMKERADSTGEGRFYNRLVAMLMARLTIEAYANFLLDVLAPEIFAEERGRFGSSLGAKLEFLHERCGLPLIKGCRPYQTVPALDRLRDQVVHAKPEVYRGAYEHSADVEAAPMNWGELQQAVEAQTCDRAFEDVPALVGALHAAASSIASAEQRRRLQPRALEGSLQHQVTATTLV